MIVDSLTKRPATSADPQASREPGVNPPAGIDSRFASLLGPGADAATKPVKLQQAAEAAAELLRLDMMRSAFSLGETEGGGGAAQMSSRAIELVLKSFAENGRKPDAASSGTSEALVEASSPPNTSSSPPLNSDNWLDGVVARASRRYGVEVGLIRAVIKAESNFNPNAVSHAGAQGLMQLMPATARGLGVTNSFDPEQNVMAGTRFLKELLDRYDGNVDKALAAYNWGPGNVDRKPHLLPRETREYLVKVKQYYAQQA